MRAWRDEVATTWLVDGDLVAAFDSWIRERLVAHRADATAESAGPWTVDLLVADIIRFGDEQRWLWCTSAIAALAGL